MISEKYNVQEQNNLNEIEEMLNKNNAYINIGIGEKAVLQFLPSRKIEEVEKTYNGQIIKKIRFIVTVPYNGNDVERFFDVGKRSARLILAKLKEGYTLLKIERIGSGKDTLYIPTEVTN